MPRLNLIAAAFVVCGTFAANAAFAQTPPAPPVPPSPPVPAAPVGTPPMPPPAPAPAPTLPGNPAPPTTVLSPVPNQTMQQQQQTLHNGVDQRAEDSMRRNGTRPAGAATLGQPASSSSIH